MWLGVLASVYIILLAFGLLFIKGATAEATPRISDSSLSKLNGIMVVLIPRFGQAKFQHSDLDIKYTIKWTKSSSDCTVTMGFDQS